MRQELPIALLWKVWKLFCSLAVPAFLSAAILPEAVGPFHKTGSKVPALENRAVWDEYGLKDSEEATYENAGQTLRVIAYRMQDTTAGLAAFQWQRPAGAQPNPKLAELTRLAASTATGEIVALGNHLLILDGYHPTPDEIANVFRSLPKQESGPLPTLPDHLPEASLIPGSERYITGPASLALFDPEVSPSNAAFHLGTEVQSGLYRVASGGELKLAIFSFPTPEAARERTTILGKAPNSIVKRSGPLVAVVFNPADANAAEKLLARVRYEASITTGEKPPSRKDNWGNFMVNISVLIGILLVFTVLSGLVFGGLRMLFRRGGASGDGEEMITLHLGNR
jgi:hypothetical protein